MFLVADWWTKSKWVEDMSKHPWGAGKAYTAIVLEALSAKRVPTGNNRNDAKNHYELKPKPKVPDDKTAAVSHYKAILRLLRRTIPGGDRAKKTSAAQLQATATFELSNSWNKAITLGDNDIDSLLCGDDELGTAKSPDEVDAWIGKVEKRFGAVADVDDWNKLVNLVGIPILLREIKTRRASNAGAVSGEDAPTTRSGSCKPFPSLLAVGIVITSFNRDEWDAVVLAMENARFFASEARAMTTTRDAADAHYEEYKQHMIHEHAQAAAEASAPRPRHIPRRASPRRARA